MKRYFTVLSVVFGILLSWGTTAANAAGAESALEVMPVTATVNSASGTNALSDVDKSSANPAKPLLVAEELTSLQGMEVRSPELLKQAAAGCWQEWDPNIGQYRRVCRTPFQEGIMGGMIGVLLGSLGGPAGAVAGGVVGFIVFYAID